MTNLTYHKVITALLVVDPYKDFISEGGQDMGPHKGRSHSPSAASRRLRILMATSVAAAQMSAPIIKVRGTSTRLAREPATRLPSGIIAPKTKVQIPITRPRI